MTADAGSPRLRRRVVVLLVFLIVSLPVAAYGVVVSTNVYLVEPGVVESEDVYVAASAAQVLGTVDGDLVVAASNVAIAGTVTGDLIVATSGSLVIDGTVEGSVRGVARNVVVSGRVGDDVAVAALDIEITGSVDRDVLLFAGSYVGTGSIGRDVLGRAQLVEIDGEVGGDVDVLVGVTRLGSNAEVAGDVIYRSGADASVAVTAEVGGSLVRVPSRGSFAVRTVLLLVTIVHFLSFLFAGLVLMWLFPATMSNSVTTLRRRPWLSLAAGVAGLIGIPVLIVLLVMTLVGIPVGLVVLMLYVLALFFGPIPAVTAAGHAVLRGRGALFGGFLLGAVLWRGAIWALPFVPLLVYLVSLIMGFGATLVAVAEQRRSAPPASLPLVPAGAPAEPAEATDPEWVPPLAPRTQPDDTDGEEGT